jgi:hypothetical protein
MLPTLAQDRRIAATAGDLDGNGKVNGAHATARPITTPDGAACSRERAS